MRGVCQQIAFSLVEKAFVAEGFVFAPGFAQKPLTKIYNNSSIVLEFTVDI